MTSPTIDRPVGVATRSPSTPGSRLAAKIDLAYPALAQASQRLWASPRVAEIYPAYLVTMHGVVRSATPLMEAALEQARRLAPHDEVAAALVPYLTHHAPEEAGHERWILEDLEALGADPEDPARRMPPASVATLVGAQYYWLRHHHPVTLLGHMAVIEGHPPQPGFADRLRRATGLPHDAFRTIARHEQLDTSHARELVEIIDALPLRPEHETMMGVSALHTIESAIVVFDELAASGPRHQPSGPR